MKQTELDQYHTGKPISSGLVKRLSNNIRKLVSITIIDCFLGPMFVCQCTGTGSVSTIFCILKYHISDQLVRSGIGTSLAIMCMCKLETEAKPETET